MKFRIKILFPELMKWMRMPTLLWCSAGTNDFGHGDAPLGSFSDRTPYTFYGACHLLMESLINKYPASTIFVYDAVT